MSWSHVPASSRAASTRLKAADCSAWTRKSRCVRGIDVTACSGVFPCRRLSSACRSCGRLFGQPSIAPSRSPARYAARASVSRGFSSSPSTPSSSARKPSASPWSSSAPSLWAFPRNPKRCGPTALGNPRVASRSRIGFAFSTAAGPTPRTLMPKRLPPWWPRRSLLPCRSAQWTWSAGWWFTRVTQASSCVLSGSPGSHTERCCRVTACLSLSPACPTALCFTRNAFATALIAWCVVAPRFSTNRYRCSPSPDGSYSGSSSTVKSSGRCFSSPPVPGRSAVSIGTVEGLRVIREAIAALIRGGHGGTEARRGRRGWGLHRSATHHRRLSSQSSNIRGPWPKRSRRAGGPRARSAPTPFLFLPSPCLSHKEVSHEPECLTFGRDATASAPSVDKRSAARPTLNPPAPHPRSVSGRRR